MILNWTSSVNKSMFPDNSGPYTRKEVMAAHIWNLYAALTSSYWTPVSSSYSSSLGFQLGTHWESMSNISFPEKMCEDLGIHDIVNQFSTSVSDTSYAPYEPTEHSWVTLSKSCDDGSAYYVTIDCRYPLPPHLPNVDVLIERDANKADLTQKYTFKYDRTVRDTSFLGTSGIFKDTVSVVDDNVKPVGTDTAYLEEQYLNIFKGLAFREEAADLYSFNTTAAAVINGQDYASRCVAFVDIVFHKGTDLLIKQNNPITNPSGDDPTYISATTRVRPKSSEKDSNSWYVCWGFDFIEKNTLSSYKLNDLVDYTRYKYAFHTTGDSAIEFIYQVYDSADNSFKSSIALLPVRNRQQNDTFTHTSMCINCNPTKSSYANKTINFNTNGREIKLLDANLPNQVSSINSDPPKTTVNNYFNTCFRNYNFSDGIKSIYAGEGGKIGSRSALPIHASLSVTDSVIYTDSLPYVSCSFESVKNQQVKVQRADSSDNKHYGINTGFIKLIGNTAPMLAGVTSNSINNKTNQYRYKIKRITSGNPFYAFSYHSDSEARKLVFDINGNPIKYTLTDAEKQISLTTSTSDTPDRGTGSLPTQVHTKTLGVDAFPEYVYFTSPERLNLKGSKMTIDAWEQKTGLFFSDLFSQEIFTNIGSEKKVLLKVSSQEVGLPKASNLLAAGSAATKFNPAKERVQNDTLIDAINEINGGADNVDDIVSTPNLTWYSKYVFPNAQPQKPPRGSTIPNFKAPAPAGSRSNKQEKYMARDNVYIEVSLKDIYADAIQEDNTNYEIVRGNFSKVHDEENLKKSQDYGSNFFSTFKCCNKTFGTVETFQEQLAATVYTFAKNKEEIYNKSIFGFVNYEESKDDKKYIVNRDGSYLYSELPIFLFSTNDNANGKFKGFIPDLTLAPTSLNDCTLVKAPNGSSKIYRKIYWAGCWWPWVSDEEPDVL